MMSLIDVLKASATASIFFLTPFELQAQVDSVHVGEEASANSDRMPIFFSCKELMGEESDSCTQMEIIKHVSRHTIYPPGAKNRGVQGTVFVYFVVGEDGNVRNVKVLRGVDHDLDREAVRVVQSLPKFEPGIFKGEFVPVEYTVPVKFMIQRRSRKRN